MGAGRVERLSSLNERWDMSMCARLCVGISSMANKKGTFFVGPVTVANVYVQRTACRREYIRLEGCWVPCGGNNSF